VAEQLDQFADREIEMGAAEFLVKARKLVGDADKWRAATDLVLNWAAIGVSTPGNKLTDDALALVDRCFKINSHSTSAQKIADLAAIKGVFKNMADFYADVKKGTEYLNVGPPVRPNDIAYAPVGGWAKKDKKGLTFVLAQCESKNDVDLIDVITHESVHFAGNINHYNIGSTPAYGSTVFTLTNAQAKQNASSYAYLAYLARLQSSQWATAT
jgi:hypothetical protein